MLQSAKKILWILFAVAAAQEAGAFSLTGPLETWQTQALGYGLNTTVVSDNGGTETTGPKNLGEEYRWNTPFLVYSFDPSFLAYFGEKGVEAVDAAIKILNDLPPASQMSPDLREFPLDTRRYNYQAAALRIRDMKTWTLSILLEAMGLSVPERYAFTLRGRTLIGPIPVYVTLKRHFDPVTFEPSSYINGTLYTYTIVQTRATPADPFDAWEPIPISVDPYQASPSTVAAYVGMFGGASDPRGTAIFFNPGIFYTGLSRDDAGGIRYLLSRNNLNVENVPTNAIVAFSSGGLADPGIGSRSTSVPWAIVGGVVTQPTGGGATGVGGAAGGGVPGAGAGGVTGTNTLVDLALRPGVDKLSFKKANFDSFLGQFFTNNVVYADSYATNGALRSQLVQRTVTQPDILFSAADLGLDPAGTPYLFNRVLTFQNNEAQNRAPGGTALGGPGVVNSPVEITFSKIGPWFLNIGGGGETLASRGLAWGSYDSSTNAPIVFPSGTSIRDLERLILTQSGGTSPWQVP
ncbi:MAG: hypothetical protein FJ398_00575 [Verrucomicrobia bacterium]|nr:hypothetical protein [Verrucomicrobiota bacterium]